MPSPTILGGAGGNRCRVTAEGRAGEQARTSENVKYLLSSVGLGGRSASVRWRLADVTGVEGKGTVLRCRFQTEAATYFEGRKQCGI